MTQKITALAAIAAMAIGLALYSGCTGERDGSEAERGSLTKLQEPETALSEELMLCLGQAKNFHHKADVLLSDGKLDEAADEVENILAIPFPTNAPESEDALLDTRARLAKLRIAQDRLDDALELVDEGIRTTERKSFFLANLHTVRGEVFEARSKSFEPGSDEANRAKLEAIGAFDTSIQINNTLLEKLKPEPQP